LLCHHETDAGSLEDELLVLTKCLKATPVILVSDAEDASIILRALASGARGYIPANLPLTVAIQAMQVVEAGGTYLPVTALLALQRSLSTVAASDHDARKILTSRQKAVLLALRQGKANKVIALELNMRESTVKVHVRNIMRKVNAKNRTEVSFKTNGMFTTAGTGLGNVNGLRDEF
jgi:DNA-binding NarL/FixJ family response regulator